jgi:hypothetical protein
MSQYDLLILNGTVTAPEVASIRMASPSEVAGEIWGDSSIGECLAVSGSSPGYAAISSRIKIFIAFLDCVDFFVIYVISLKFSKPYACKEIYCL